MIKKWLVTIDVINTKIDEVDETLSDQDIYDLVPNRTKDEILIKYSYNRSIMGVSSWFSIVDDLHKRIKGRYKLVWANYHTPKIIIYETEDFMVQWKLEDETIQKIEEINEDVRPHKFIIPEYTLENIKPDWVNDHNDLNKFWNDKGPECEIQHEIEYKNNKVARISTLKKLDVEFLKDDSWYFSSTIDDRFDDTVIRVLASDSRFKEIMNHFNNAKEIVPDYDYRIINMCGYDYMKTEFVDRFPFSGEENTVPESFHWTNTTLGNDGEFITVFSSLQDVDLKFLGDIEFDFFRDRPGQLMRVKCSEERHKEIQDYFDKRKC